MTRGILITVLYVLAAFLWVACADMSWSSLGALVVFVWAHNVEKHMEWPKP